VLRGESKADAAEKARVGPPPMRNPTRLCDNLSEGHNVPQNTPGKLLDPPYHVTMARSRVWLDCSRRL